MGSSFIGSKMDDLIFILSFLEPGRYLGPIASVRSSQYGVACGTMRNARMRNARDGRKFIPNAVGNCIEI